MPYITTPHELTDLRSKVAIGTGKATYTLAICNGTGCQASRSTPVVEALKEQLAKQGLAGWNSRIAYSEGKWLPYFETDDPYIIRIFAEDATIDEAVDVPKEMIIFPTASVSPGGKSITQWGRVKGGL